MNPTLVRALFLLFPTMLLLFRSAWLFAQSKRAGPLFQMLGAGFLLTVVATHIAEATHVLASLGWGRANSAGHYLDLSSAVLGLVLLFLGLSLEAMERRRDRPALAGRH